jgi:putative transposase
VDNGPELISATLTDWCEDHDIERAYISLASHSRMSLLSDLMARSGESFLMCICLKT